LETTLKTVEGERPSQANNVEPKMRIVESRKKRGKKKIRNIISVERKKR